MKKLWIRIRNALFVRTKPCPQCAGAGRLKAQNFLQPGMEALEYDCRECEGSGEVKA